MAELGIQMDKQIKSYSSGKIDQIQIEDLKHSEENIGQIYPVLKDSSGNIINGFHRKRVNPAWKEEKLSIDDKLQSLKLRVHLNIMRRRVADLEKGEWIMEARRILQERGFKGTQKEIGKALGMSQRWVSKYDPEPLQPHEYSKLARRANFFGYNVWGFKDESWRKLILPADPNQPIPTGYHGITPAFVIHQLIKMFQPKRVLDSMAGIGTTGYICAQYEIECDQFDIYPFPKYGVLEGDAEIIDTNKKYDLIFNHIPYFNMVKYGEHQEDLSNMPEPQFFEKMHRIFAKNTNLLENKGIYAILVGDKRRGGEVFPITAKITLMGTEYLALQDIAIKLSGEMQLKELQEYRATKFGHLASTYDTVLIFRRKISGKIQR